MIRNKHIENQNGQSIPAEGGVVVGASGEVVTDMDTLPGDEGPTDREPLRVRRMTRQDRLDAYAGEVRAYHQWTADGSPGGIYKIPKHPDDADKEYAEARERDRLARQRKPGGVQLIGHLLLPRW